MRWTEYPEAKTPAEAREMSLSRGARDERSHRAKIGWINHKYKVREREAEAQAANYACQVLRYEIAMAPVTGALATAIKLGVWVYDQGWDNRLPKPSDCFDDQGAAATMSVYRHAVAECGFDPAATARTAMRKCERTNAMKAVA
jgi:hypothetical protein